MQTQKENNSSRSILIKNLKVLLIKGNAHVSLDEAIKDISFELLGEKPNGLPYSLWQLTEHIRIAQADILEFSTNENYKNLEWPEDYWPKELAPDSADQWKDCVEKIKTDRSAFIDLLVQAGDNLYVPFEHGTGQSLLKEALLIADHNSYHTGEIIVLRRLLGDWK